MLSLHNIHPLTDFKRNASTYIDQVRKSLAPVVLTVNGKAAVVVQDAGAYQAMIDRLQFLEQELQSINRASLLQAIDLGIEQLDQGQFSEYSSETIPDLFADIRKTGRQDLGLAE
jgi:prevent-host-death family protein